MGVNGSFGKNIVIDIAKKPIEYQDNIDVYLTHE
ncbi:hypothetical protein [Candidatus Kinetoplastidibacterium blastocrithidiae]|nr:hypothetical protein [Candidatus Kinetoplastibacterium blastocrithidii]